MSWRLAYALVALRNGVNAKWPGRDKTSDGTIGDAAHASRASDHNPFVIVDDVGVVRALDIDVDGIDAGWVAEQLRLLGAADDPRLTGGGYVILNHRITSNDFSHWNAYTGSDPHTGHIHVSFSLNRAGFDSTAMWGFLAAKSTTTSSGKAASDMSTRLMRGDNTAKVPGKSYSWGDLQFLVKFDPEIPGGALRCYVAAGPLQAVLEKAQGGVDVVKQKDLDAIPYATGGAPPASVTSR